MNKKLSLQLLNISLEPIINYVKKFNQNIIQLNYNQWNLNWYKMIESWTFKYDVIK